MTKIAHPAEEEFYLKICEEAHEIGHAVCKLLQHGPWEFNPKSPADGTNKMHLSAELGDMLGLIKWAFENNYVDHYVLQEAARTKMHRVAEYSHHILVHPNYVPIDL